MGSLMNLALVAGALQTKYLNQVLVVDRGSYENLPLLLGVVMAIGLCVPLAAILLFGKKLSGAEVERRSRSTLERAASAPARETN
jgi:hypothetical protein